MDRVSETQLQASENCNSIIWQLKGLNVQVADRSKHKQTIFMVVYHTRMVKALMRGVPCHVSVMIVYPTCMVKYLMTGVLCHADVISVKRKYILII